MGRGDNPNSRANLAGAAGGDRFADKRAILALIETALFEAFLDIEVRDAFGLRAWHPVEDWRRRRLARARARRVYDAMISAFCAAASEDLSYWALDDATGQYKRRLGGLELTGLARIGLRLRDDVAVEFWDDYGVNCSITPAAGEVQMYRRETYDNGYYAFASMAADDSRLPLFLALGWFCPWWAQEFKGSLMYGPIPDDEVLTGGWVRALVPWPGASSGNGDLIWHDVDYQKLGTRNYGAGMNEGWAYRNAGGFERMPNVRWGRPPGSDKRLVTNPSVEFVALLTGPATVAG